MTAEIMHHLAAAGRMPDVNRILQIKMIGDGLQIIGIVVHVMSVAGLTRATMSAAISRNDAIAFAEEKEHLDVPVIGRERPAVTEDNRLSAAPVFIIDLYSVLSGNRVSFPFFRRGFCLRRWRIRSRGVSGHRGKSGNCREPGGANQKFSTRDIDVSVL